MAELVYIVDDEPNILQLVSLGLDDAGFDTQTFSDGESFLAAVKKQMCIRDSLLGGLAVGVAQAVWVDPCAVGGVGQKVVLGKIQRRVHVGQKLSLIHI